LEAEWDPGAVALLREEKNRFHLPRIEPYILGCPFCSLFTIGNSCKLYASAALPMRKETPVPIT
jgi:hypothetical protein